MNNDERAQFTKRIIWMATAHPQREGKRKQIEIMNAEITYNVECPEHSPVTNRNGKRRRRGVKREWKEHVIWQYINNIWWRHFNLHAERHSLSITNQECSRSARTLQDLWNDKTQCTGTQGYYEQRESKMLYLQHTKWMEYYDEYRWSSRGEHDRLFCLDHCHSLILTLTLQRMTAVGYRVDGHFLMKTIKLSRCNRWNRCIRMMTMQCNGWNRWNRRCLRNMTIFRWYDITIITRRWTVILWDFGHFGGTGPRRHWYPTILMIFRCFISR